MVVSYFNRFQQIVSPSFHYRLQYKQTVTRLLAERRTRFGLKFVLLLIVVLKWRYSLSSSSKNLVFITESSLMMTILHTLTTNLVKTTHQHKNTGLVSVLFYPALNVYSYFQSVYAQESSSSLRHIPPCCESCRASLSL